MNIDNNQSFKRSIAVTEGASFLCKKEDLDNYDFFFKNLNECLGVVINFTDGRKFLYHKSGADNMANIEKELKDLHLSTKDIKDIKIVGGNITNCCIPLKGNNIYRYSRAAHKEYIGDYNYRKRTPYKNLVFRIPRDGLVHSDELERINQGSQYNTLDDDIFNIEKNYEERVANLEKKLKDGEYIAEAIGRDGQLYCFKVQDVQNIRGIRNIYEMKAILNNVFPDVQCIHKFCPRGCNIQIRSDGFLVFQDHHAFVSKMIPVHHAGYHSYIDEFLNESSPYQTYSNIFLDKTAGNPLTEGAFTTPIIKNIEALTTELSLNDFLKTLQDNILPKTKSSHIVNSDINYNFKIREIEIQKPPHGTKVMHSKWTSNESIQKLMAQALAKKEDYTSNCLGRVLNISSISKKNFSLQTLKSVYAGVLKGMNNNSIRH